MWMLLALLAALFTSLTAIFAKIGIRDVSSNFATLYRTVIVTVCSAFICLVTGSFAGLQHFTWQNYLFLGLSGVATWLSWLCYNRAIKSGQVSRVAPIDKSSFVVANLLFLLFFFDETTNSGDPLTICMLVLSMALMLAGTLLMLDRKPGGEKGAGAWLLYAVLSAVFAGLVSLLVKLGLRGVSSNVGTLLRSLVVIVFLAGMLSFREGFGEVKTVTRRSWLFLTLSGMATGGAWLCEYAALNAPGVNPVAVNSVGKLAILPTMLFCRIVLGERFTKKTLTGLSVLVAGIVLIIVFGL